MRNVQVCYSPALFQFYDSTNRIIVVTDILRATSAIVTAFQYGVKSIIPVATIEDALMYRQNGYMAAAERNGIVQDGFEFGNSPFSYMTDHVKGQTIALTTTNGTQAVEIAKEASKVIIGAFINLSACANWILEQNENVTILCSGWKNRFNLEDTLFAGAVIDRLQEHFSIHCDSSLMAVSLYRQHKDNLLDFAPRLTHYHRLVQRFGLIEDITFCLTPDAANVLPFYKDGKLIIKK